MVENTPFPIIDNAAIANSYQISYYPTVFRICPDGLVYEAGQLTGSQFESIIQSSFGCDMALTGISEKALASVDDVNLCDDNTAADLSVTVNNYGINPITSVTLGINDGSQTTQITESVSIPKWGNAPVTINTVLSNANDYSVSITGINGNAMAAENIMTQDFEVNSAVQALENIEIHIHTDFYPAEASWKLYDSNDVEIAAGVSLSGGNSRSVWRWWSGCEYNNCTQCSITNG